MCTTYWHFDKFFSYYFSFFYIIQNILPILIKNKWGRVINFSSTGGLAGEIGTLLYSSSKYASLGMTKVLSKEYPINNLILSIDSNPSNILLSFILC